MHDTLRHHKVTIYSGGSAPLIARKVRPNDPCPCAVVRRLNIVMVQIPSTTVQNPKSHDRT